MAIRVQYISLRDKLNEESDSGEFIAQKADVASNGGSQGRVDPGEPDLGDARPAEARAGALNKAPALYSYRYNK
jgi:hypothetical protein